MPEVETRFVSFDTTEGTFMNVDVSPDGGTLIFDLLGDIYALPYAGGKALPLTSGRAWDQAPRYSPDGAHVYFLSDREGYKNIWRLTLGDGSLKQVTRSDSDIVGGPNWSQDGSHILVGRGDPSTRNTEFILQSVDPDTGNMTPIDAPAGPWVDWDTFETLRPRVTIYSGVESSDGNVISSHAQYDRKRKRVTVRMHRFDRKTQTRSAITPADAPYSDYKPQLSPSGSLLAYFRQYSDRRTEIRILNRKTGEDEVLLELVNADDASYTLNDDSRPNYAFTPNEREIIYWHGGKIHSASLADGSVDIVSFRVKVEREVWARVKPTVRYFRPSREAKIIRWPSLSRDGQMMAFAAIGYVWLMDLTTGELRRLTDSSDFEYMPAISSDGRTVAYVSFAQSGNDYGPGRLMIADVDGGASREILAGPNETYLLPKWSEDKEKIAVIREVETANGIEADFGWTPIVGGQFHSVAAAPASSDLLATSIYSRFVGFDEAGRSLLFGFPRSKSETVLASAYLDGDRLQTLAIATPEVGGITPAPDLNNLALTRHDGTVWIVPFAEGDERSVSTLVPDAHRVSNGGGYYVDWNRPSQLTFGFARSVYRYRMDEGKLEFLRIKVPLSTPKIAPPIAFKGARLITMSDDSGAGHVIESGTVVLSGRRIAAIGPASEIPIPAGALEVDATGKTIMPGLLDTHYHRIGGSGGAIGVSAFKLPNPNFSDRSAITYGVTTAWEPGGALDDGVPATVDLRDAGRILGPRWSHSAMGAVGYPYEQLTTYAAALAAVEQHRVLGVAVLKEYSAPTRQQRQWLSVAAREMGLGIVSHIQSFDGMMTRIVDGYSGGDHPYMPVPFYKDVHELLRQTGYIWTPNIVITSGAVGTSKDKRVYYCRAALEWMNRTNRGNEERGSLCDPDQAIPTVPYDIHRVSRVAKQVALAASNGVHIGVSAHNMPASTLHLEMWYLWKGGMPIEDVLNATTIGNAEKLGLQEEIGSLESGKIADFLVLDENPLDDILNTLSLEYTIQGGVVYDSTTGQVVDLMSMREAAVHQDE